MGARAEQQLALNFLAVVHQMWAERPGTYVVDETTDDLVPALAQMCIKALAAEIRDTIDHNHQGLTIEGELVRRDGTTAPVTMRDITNKIVHGTPAKVAVHDGAVRLYFENNEDPSERVHDWASMWFSGSDMITALSRLLYKHNEVAAAREREIRRLLESLGVDRILPSRSTTRG